MERFRRFLFLLLVMSFEWSGVPAGTVTTCDEASLRAALIGGGAVTFACDGTIVVTGTLALTNNTMLDGSGHSVLISGDNAVRVLFVPAGVEFTMKNVTLANGGGTSTGAGLLNNGQTHLVNCTFSNNVVVGSPGFGGGVYLGSGSLIVEGCSFLNNRVDSTNGIIGVGGAIGSLNTLVNGPLLITNSTFYGNSAAPNGGTIAINFASGTSGPMAIVNCTFANNTNGAVASGSPLTLKNTIALGTTRPNFSGTLIDGGYNISSDASGNFTHPFSLNNTDPMLAPLANNGGPTLTLALLPGSPAIDGGDSSACLPTDQRGVARPFGSGCDIGALEATVPGTNAGVFQLSVNSTIIESATNVVVNVIRAGGVAGTASVSFGTSSGTATTGADFVGTNGTLVFGPGVRTNSFSVAILDDTLVEGAEMFSIALSNPTVGAALGRSSATITILDNDSSMSFSSPNYTVGEGDGTAVITVNRAGATNSTSSVSFETSPGTAMAGVDYRSTNGVLTFAPGQTNATFSVAIIDGTSVNGDRSVLLTLSNPLGGNLTLGNPANATLTIYDNDGERLVTTCDEASLRFALNIGGRVRLACDGTITLSNTISMSRNSSLDAGGHYVTVSGNDAVGVFQVQSGVEFSITNVTIAHGFTSAGGGGIDNLGALKVMNCTFASNAAVFGSAPAGFGGAIHNQGTLTVASSSFFNNRASYIGGAIASIALFASPPGPVVLTNCTFVENSTTNGATVANFAAAPCQAVNCTFLSNTGGGIATSSGNFTLINSILANSSGANCSGITDGGNNISSDNSCGFTNVSSHNNTDPKLGPLADNGGPTLTVSLLEGSPAIDAANAASCPSTDQRGFPRPYGIGCDIGAFETTLIGTNRGTFQFSASSYSAVESQSELEVAVIRAGGALGSASVDFATSNNTATAGEDYVATNGTLTFAQGEAQKTFRVRLLDHNLQEGDETFFVALSNPTGGTALGNPHTAVVTIIDDETPAVVTSCDDASLRTALAANRPVVAFACDGVIVLTNTVLIPRSVSLNGSGHNVTLSGSNAVRLFLVSPAVTFALQHLTLADGMARGTNGDPGQAGGSGEGGAIYNNGATILAQDCLFIRNTAQGGTGGLPPSSFSAAGAGGWARGGVFFNTGSGQITASNCQIALNWALGGTGGNPPSSSSFGGNAAGGSIYNESGVIHLSRCGLVSNTVVSGQGRRLGGLQNSGIASGGALFSSGTEVTLSNVLLSANTSAAEYAANAYGGSIHLAGGMLRAVESRFTSNRVLGGNGLGIGTSYGIPGSHGFGGAVSMIGGNGQFLNSTLDHNLALGGAEPGGGSPAGSAFGGALYNSGEAQLLNCTLASNQAQSGPARAFLPLHGRARGGAACNDGGNTILSSVTIAGNAALHSGGGSVGYFEGGGLFSTNGLFTSSNSIVAYSASGSNGFGNITDGGHNISSDASCHFSAPGSLNSTDPVLGPLADYGGPTPTMPLLTGSPALNTADAISCPPTDQRGVARPYGAGCDIGACESAPPYTILGSIGGFLKTAGGMTVRSGAFTSSVGSDGGFRLYGLPPGTTIVTPIAPDAVFVLSNQVLNIGFDLVGINFHAYQSNAFAIERLNGHIVRSDFAGAAGESWQVFTSTNFSQWFPYSTYTVQPSGLFEFFYDTSPTSGVRFFKSQKQ